VREAGVLLDKNRRPLYWHAPAGRSVAYLPDSRDLWDVIWENRATISGFAHVHPGGGVPWPSNEDVTTFHAVEVALGVRLEWWIATQDAVAVFHHNEDSAPYVYTRSAVEKPDWYDELMRLANKEE
jgi:hypothetical protein